MTYRPHSRRKPIEVYLDNDPQCRLTPEHHDVVHPFDEPDDSAEPDDLLDPDDECWDAFQADDDERDPQPEPGDFWPADPD